MFRILDLVLMYNILTIFKKEFRSYFNSPIAYIFLVVFLIVTNWLFFARFFLAGQVSLRSFFMLLPWMFLIVLPAIAMRLWSEEKRQGSIELLLTLPLKDVEVVLGKFFAVLAFVFVALCLTLPTTFTVIALGEADYGEIISGYAGSFLLGASLLALGAFISSLTRNQIVAFLLTLVFSFIAIVISEDYVLLPVGGLFADVLNFFSLSSHYNVLSRGIVDAGDIVYFLGFIFFFLFLNTKVLQARYYKG